MHFIYLFTYLFVFCILAEIIWNSFRITHFVIDNIHTGTQLFDI